MKKNIVSAILAVSMFLIANIASAQLGSCYVLYCELYPSNSAFSEKCVNTDSVYIDTCHSSPTYNEAFGNRWFELYFTDYVIDLATAPHDSILEVSWTAIDTSYSTLRTSFSDLESKYGTLWLKKAAPEADSNYLASHGYYLRFENYICIDSVMDDLKNISDLDAHFISYPKTYDRLVENPSEDMRFISITLSNFELRIHRNDNQPICNLTLYNLNGAKVLEKEFSSSNSEVSVNVALLPNSVYLVQCDQSKLQKILLQQQ